MKSLQRLPCKMRLTLSGLFSIVLILSSSSLSLNAAPQANIKTLINELSDDDYQVRENALTEFLKIGPPSLPALEGLLDSSNPEIQARAKELTLHIKVGLLHNSPAEVKELVIQYQNADENSRYLILSQLKNLGYWEQALKLVKHNQSIKLSNQLIKLTIQLVQINAQKAVLENNPSEAKRIIELLPNSKEFYLHKAWFYKYQEGNNFEKIIQKSASLKGTDAHHWRMALHCVNNNISSALNEAIQSGDTSIQNTLHMLEGNPLPMLENEMEKKHVSENIQTSWQIQIDKLKGNNANAEILAQSLISTAKSANNHSHEVSQLILFLAANGYKNDALELLKQKSPIESFDYHLNLDQPEKSLAAFGIPSTAKPPYISWIEETTELAKEESEYIEKLRQMASLHASLGDTSYAMDTLTPIINHLEKNNIEGWYDIIQHLMNLSMGEQALSLLSPHVKKPEDSQLAIRSVLGLKKKTPLKAWQKNMWSFLEQRNQGDLTKNLYDLALLSGKLNDPEQKSRILHDTLIEEVSQLPAKEQATFIDALYQFTKFRNDYTATFTMAQAFAKEDPQWQKTVLVYNIKMQNWDQLETWFKEQTELHPTQYNNWVNWYIALRKLGEKSQANKVYNKMLLITMMNSYTLNRIAYQLYNVGYSDKALEIWQQVTLHRPLNESISANALQYLSQYGQALYHQNKWKKANAIHEVAMQAKMGGGINLDQLASILQHRFYTDFCHGMALYHEGEKEEAISVFDSCQNLMAGSGSLADEFFPLLRQINIGDHYEQWFEQNYQILLSTLEKHPRSHNLHNTAAWLASRALLKLDKGLEHAKIATKLKPHQGAYLDTMAEIWFAKGDRAEAIKWSEKAALGALSHIQGFSRSEAGVFNNYHMLKRQQLHFREDKLPKPYQFGKN